MTILSQLRLALDGLGESDHNGFDQPLATALKKFVKITNRGTYTNPNKAMHYVERGLAKVTESSDKGEILAIHMLESAELAMTKSGMKMSRMVYGFDPVSGKFEWYVADSGGSSLMRQYEGLGGYRVLQASHNIK